MSGRAGSLAAESLLHGHHTFPKSERLQHGHQFRAVFDRGRKTAGHLVVLHVLAEPVAAPSSPRPGPLNTARCAVGIVTGRRVGNAVIRNRARRLLREAYRLNKEKLKPNLQLVLVARAAIRGKRLPEVAAELLRLFGAAGLLVES